MAYADQQMKSLRVDNLGCHITAQALSTALTLDTSPALRKLVVIDLMIDDKDTDQKYYAIINKVPEVLADEILKLSGMEVGGYKIQINPYDGSAVQSQSYAEVTKEADSGTIERKVVEIDLRRYHNPYGVRSIQTSIIAQAVMASFPFDDSKQLIPISKDKSLFKLDTKNPDLYQNVTTLVHNGADIGQVSLKVETQMMTQSGKIVTRRAKPKDELLITLQNANSSDFHDITEDVIYEKIIGTGVGTIKIGLTVQKYAETELPNGNLYFVLKGLKEDDKEKLPQFFAFGARRMYLQYRGKMRKCSFCREHHQGVCAQEAKIRMMERERDRIKENNGGNFTVKTYSNSTLRYTNQMALASNVDAMPGGTTGNVLNAVDIDEELGVVSNVLLITGQGDLSQRLNTEEFLWGMKTKSDRILQLANTKQVAIMPPPYPQDAIDSEVQARVEAFHDNLKKLSEHENVLLWENPVELYDEDAGNHPSREQTSVILNFLNDKCLEVFNTRLTLFSAPQDALTTNRLYAGVNALYKYGCSACSEKERNSWFGLCNTCKNAMEESDDFKLVVDAFQKRVQEFKDAALPPLHNDVQQSECHECGINLEGATAIKEHFKSHHSDKEKSRNAEDIRSDAKGRRTKGVPEKSL